MKKLLYIVSLAALTLNLQAQDAQILAQRDLVGTARYVGLAGAMTAVGGDPSAVNVNPAGLGVYRRWDVNLSLYVDVDRVSQVGQTNLIGARNKFSASQASFVFGWVDQSRDRGMIANNVMISYHNIANYNRQYKASNVNDPYSLSDVIAAKTNGVDESALQPAERWDKENWLSNQAYDTYLISPDPSDTKRWYSILEAGQVVDRNQLTMHEYGSIDQFGISWGGNISNIIYLGATLNILAYDHTQSVRYTEQFGEGCSMDNNTYVHHSGVGVNGNFGIIAHPLQWLRIGASFTTPSAVSLTTRNYGDMNSTLYMYDAKEGKNVLTNFTSKSLENSYIDRTWTSPMRVSAGLAFQALNYGLVSFQYDYAHHKQIDDIHTLRAGIEGVIVNHFFLEAGYAYESTFLKNEQYYSPGILPENTVRTDAYSQIVKRSHYATAGFGYRGKNFAVHAAYRYRWQSSVTYPHEFAIPYDINATTHNFVLTLNFHTQ